MNQCSCQENIYTQRERERETERERERETITRFKFKRQSYITRQTHLQE